MSQQRPKWPLVLLALPAAVAIWAGWVGLGQMTGFGVVQLLPGIWDGLRLNTAITLPVGMEAYAAYALGESLRRSVPARARQFARHSAMVALTIGCLGQITFHLMQATSMRAAPWPITMLVSCLPVGVLGMGAALYHLLDDADEHQALADTPAIPPPAREPAAPVVGASPWPASAPPTPSAPPRPPFQVVPNLTTLDRLHPTTGEQPAPTAERQPEPASASRPAPASLGRPDDQPAPRPDPSLTGRPDTTAAERPAERPVSRPDTAVPSAPTVRPARGRRSGKRTGRLKSDEQLAAAVRELAVRNGGAAPSQYQVRRALGVGGGRAARLVVNYQPTTPTSSNGTSTGAPEEAQ